ncbi:hypothetical protein BBJ29_006802 [Phytophthora kernoviae]|uniref:U2A'/phosphoprotein 32 family A C-terminal domain-containing protein n=1 Tax=Phytophthora kernoviae TaxID=325452 RepID=A0A3F2S0E5_9STRA|nr:hypothetical protein BBP00_00001417 [Phytophthora kernoviae]RLN71063.1 hypothetical protein BBJ29_006802 [Phytophthora kernoviae]
MRGEGNSTQIQVLDGSALRALSTELNSSKYAIDAHNRSIGELGNLSEFPKLCSLDVSFNKITSLRNVSTARELRELKIYNNKLTNTIGLKAYEGERLLELVSEVDPVVCICTAIPIWKVS